jgi:hypothetical protein
MNVVSPIPLIFVARGSLIFSQELVAGGAPLAR